MGKPYVSPSQIDTYEKCGQIYLHRKIEGLKMPAPGHFIVGTNTHKTSEQSLMNAKVKGVLFTDSEICDSARTNFDITEQEENEKSDGIIYSDDMPRGACIDQSIALSLCYNNEVAPAVKPIAIEEPFLINTGDYPYDIMGSIDIVEKGHDRDIKTVGSIMPVIERNVQGITYTLGHEIKYKEKAGFSFDCIKKNKVPKSVILTAQYDDADRQQLFDRIEIMANGLQAGIFIPAPTNSWYCSEKWCGYFGICKFGKKQSVSVPVGEIEF